MSIKPQKHAHPFPTSNINAKLIFQINELNKIDYSKCSFSKPFVRLKGMMLLSFDFEPGTDKRGGVLLVA
jgi:hypothetical protein